MSRILNEAGEYNPEVPVTDVAQPEIEASSLPQRTTDPYARVNAQDFSTAREMSRAQMLKMSDIAAAQGLAGVALKWKQVAASKVQAEVNAEGAARMKDMLEPKFAGTPGRILEGVQEPWQADPDYLKLQDQYRIAQSKADDADEFGADKLELQNTAVAARESLREREAQIKATLAESGAYTAQDERAEAARASLAEKSAQVVAQVRGQ